MHVESYEIMQEFARKYLDQNANLDILDVGSYDVNGSYKELFKNASWNYTGLDMVEGPNVDIVSVSPYNFGLAKQYDVVVSGNCLEHVEAPWLWIKEVEKATKKGGMVCIVTPFSIGEHRYPVDCWRILPDAYRYLLTEVADFDVIETKLNIIPPVVTYRIFSSRSWLKWLIPFLPKKIKNILEYTSQQPIDCFVVGKKR